MRMKIKQVQVGSIKPYDKNAKLHPEKQIKQVAKSIEAFGFNQPLVLDKDYNIIVGHGRLEAAKLLGLEEVPCLVTSLNEIKAKAYRLADNKLNESGWDMNLVIDELKQLELLDFDIELTGFDLGDLELVDETDLSDSLIEKWQITIDCKSEKEQEEKYNFLTENDIECRLLTL